MCWRWKKGNNYQRKTLTSFDNIDMAKYNVKVQFKLLFFRVPQITKNIQVAPKEENELSYYRAITDALGYSVNTAHSFIYPD